MTLIGIFSDLLPEFSLRDNHIETASGLKRISLPIFMYGIKSV
jgi:hypothetical protein